MTEIFENYEIKNDTTFKIGGRIEKAAFPKTINELIELLQSKEYDMVFGGCSNILFSSGCIDKKIIITKNINNYEINDNQIKVECGTKGPLVSKYAKDNALSGFEFLIGFPGTFGGMVTMNASAHNQSISDCFISARIYDLKNDKIVTLYKNDMQFNYRHSIISEGEYIVLDAIFELKKGNINDIEELMNRNIQFRKQHQPSLSFGNAGSIFKNPANDSAGRLLDLCNMKGQEEGGAKIYEKHANFIINYNNATSTDILTLMYKMYSKVREKYTIILKPEIKFVEGNIEQENKLWQIIQQENIHQIQK